MAQKIKTKLKYKRILLKLSGELFGGENGKGICSKEYDKIAKDIIKIQKRSKRELSIVVGGGNIFRGREVYGKEMNEAVADGMGMLATVMNGLALQDAIERLGIPVRMMTATKMEAVAEPFIRRRAIRHLEKGRIVIFTGGTGNPFFTTDSAAALRACEINCDVILKATNVDGVYDKDPRKYKDAKLYKELTYRKTIEKKLEVMDNTAFALCWRKKKPIIVFNVDNLDRIPEILNEKIKTGTIVH